MNYKDALNWLKKAQDLGIDDGISAYYDTRHRIWMPSYPEVSGYVIPTFIAAGEQDRALRISRWLRRKQLPEGALPAGPFNSSRPFVFDTGMVLLGWLAAQEVEYDERTAESIDRSVDFLESTWRCDPDGFLPLHNIRTIWALKLYGSKYVDSMLDWGLSYIEPNGFPRKAEDEDEPLSHFIVYVARGFYECGLVETSRSIMENLPSIPSARYDSDWNRWTDDICVPGVAQASILFNKLGMKAEAQRGLNYLSTLTAPWASDPIDANYLPGTQVSWCAKFVADAFREAGVLDS